MNARPPRRPDWFGALVGVLLVWPLAGGLIALMVWPSTPTTTRGWVLLFVLGPPAWLALEWVGGGLFGREMGERISAEPFSWARILFAVIVFCAILVPVLWWSLSSVK